MMVMSPTPRGGQRRGCHLPDGVRLSQPHFTFQSRQSSEEARVALALVLAQFPAWSRVGGPSGHYGAPG